MAWCGLAFLQGLGVASVNTVANLSVVEVHPEDQWDGRIARLQTFQDGGYVGGLLLAAGLSQLDLRLRDWVTVGGYTTVAVHLATGRLGVEQRLPQPGGAGGLRSR
jgi:hypothetical protein